MSTFLFRTDADPLMGTGHVMRCMALAQALKDRDAAVCVLSATLPEGLRSRLQKEGIEMATLAAQAGTADDAVETAEHAKKLGAEWVIVDGYQFEAAYQRALKEAGLKVLFVDDNGHAPPYSVDLVLNQNAYAAQETYRERDSYTALLLGSRYALLRREFSAWQGFAREYPPVAKRLLVTLGGSDPDNVTGRVLGVLSRIDPAPAVTVVIGGSNPHRSAIEAQAKESGLACDVLVNATNMPELMSNADLAISAAGTTCYELAFLGLPAVTIVLADNQVPVAAALAKNRSILDCGRAETLEDDDLLAMVSGLLSDPEKRRAMGEAGRLLIDGEGADRVATLLLNARIRLRTVRPEDSDLLLAWANDPVTRAVSFSSDPIPKDDHERWFEKLLKESAAQPAYIALDCDDAALGYVRFAVSGSDAVLSVAVAPDKRGGGYGKEIVREGTRLLLRSISAVSTVHAYCKPDNAASARLFKSVGFRKEADTVERGHPALHFTFTRDMLGTQVSS